MNKGVLTAVAFAAALFAWPANVRAEPIETTIAVTVNPLSGQHETGRNASDRFTFAPLPLGEVTLRRGSESLRIEGLPPIAFNYGSGPNTSIGTRTTRAWRGCGSKRDATSRSAETASSSGRR